MRIHVLAFLTVGFLSSYSYADAYKEVFKRRCTTGNCNATVEGGVKEGLCLADGKGVNCGTGVLPKYDGKAADLDAAVNSCTQKYAAANSCCNGSGCSEGIEDASAGAGFAMNDNALNESKNNSTAQSGYQKKKGRCLAYSEACVSFCKSTIDTLGASGSRGNCTPGGTCAGGMQSGASGMTLQAAIADMQRTLSSCKALDGKAADSAADAYKKGKDEAEATRDASSGGGGGGGPGGGSEGSGAGGASPQSGGGNPMGALMSALQGLMQPKEETPQEPFQSQTCAENPNLVINGVPCSVCESNPSAPGCEKAADNWNSQEAKAGFESQGTSASPDDFNTGSGNTGVSPQSIGGQGTQGAPVTVNPIQGGGGGGLPGSGGSPGGVGAGGAVGGGARGSNTDVLHGERGGGGGGGVSAMNAAMKLESGNNGGFGSYGGGARRPDMDLSQFLPGGAKDPARHLAGGNSNNFQIQSREVNIWNRISERIKARCSEGRLRDCVP